MRIDPSSEPLQLFAEWMKDAQSQGGIREPTAMALATAAPGGDVNVRVVLCKGWGPDGFLFFTNYQSRKGRDLEKNPQAGAVFYWDPLFRQVKISGPVVKISRQESSAYWQSRPRESQLSQYVSKQSQPTASREELEELVKRADQEFAGREIPCPVHWGGYRLQPKRIEFWIGQPGRLHDRFEFKKSGSGWTFCRLSP